VLWLCSRNYAVAKSTYFSLFSNLLSLFILLGVLVMQYLAAAAASLGTNQDRLLLGMGVLAFFCGLYFFLANALLNSDIRRHICCQSGPTIEKKITGYATETESHYPATATVSLAYGSTPDLSARNYSRRNKKSVEMNMNSLNYVNDYLSPQGSFSNHRSASTSPIPLTLFSQVHPGMGKGRRSGGTRLNPGHSLDSSPDT